MGEGGRYRLQRVLGTGGMASVWLAEDDRLGRSMALKLLADSLVLDRGYVARFRREAQVAAGLSHPNLVKVFDFSVAPPRPYLAMEYVPGMALSDLLRERGRAEWDPETSFRELLSALAHVHAAGIIHRDIKPGNVLIGRDGRTRLTDFGIAKPSGSERLTSTGLVIGTARYLAPEIMRGQEPNERSDLYACGVLLHDCLRDGATGHLHALVDRLTSEEPRKRPASAMQVLELLDRLAPAPTAGPPSARIYRTHRIRPWELKRAALAATIVAVVVVVIVTLTAGGSGGSHRPSPPVGATPPATAPLRDQLNYLEHAIGRARRWPRRRSERSRSTIAPPSVA